MNLLLLSVICLKLPIIIQIEFYNTFDKNRKLIIDKKEAINETINECIKNNILKEYLLEKKEDVMGIMEALYDQDFIDECREKEIRDESKAEGKAEGMLDAYVNLYKKNQITMEVVLDNLKITKEKFLSKIKELA